jgi:hypothetical protein
MSSYATYPIAYPPYSQPAMSTEVNVDQAREGEVKFACLADSSDHLPAIGRTSSLTPRLATPHLTTLPTM